MPVRWPAPYESRAEAGPAIPADFRRNGGALQPGAEAHGEPGGTWTKEHDQKPERDHLLRCLGERGFALLTCRWRALRHITTSPRKIGDIAKAALVLTHFEHTDSRESH